MKKTLFVIALFVFSGIAYADLSNFPGAFISDGKFNGMIVVANQAPASDVIAQSNLAQFFVGYLGKPITGTTKLSSEVTNLDQNIISIGSPCYNEVSAKIMDNPNPCDKDLEPGKAYIKFFDKGHVQIVVAGYSDKGTREAINALIDYQNKNFNGNVYFVSVDEPTNAKQTKSVGSQETKPALNITSISDEKNKIIEDLKKKIENKTSEIKKVVNETKSVVNQTEQKIAGFQESKKEQILQNETARKGEGFFQE